MPTEDAYSSGHLVLSHFGTCMCSNVETNLSWTCLVSGLLNFEHPSELLFCLVLNAVSATWAILRRPILTPYQPLGLTSDLKLVRTPLNVYFTAFKSIFLSLYASITSYECHAWFHLNAASPSVRNTEQVNIIKKILSTVVCEPPTPHPLISRVSLLPLRYWGNWRYEIRTFTVLIYAPIL